MVNNKLNVYFIHSDPVLSAGLRAMLRELHATDLVLHDTLDGLEQEERAVIIADYNEGIRFCQELDASDHSRCRVLVFTHFDREWDVRHAVTRGVYGYLLHSALPCELVAAVRALGNGQRYLGEQVRHSIAEVSRRSELTSREVEVLELLGQGYCNKLIARELGIGLGTVKCHMKALMTKLDATARTHAVIVATQRGLLRAGGEKHAFRPVPQAGTGRSASSSAFSAA